MPKFVNVFCQNNGQVERVGMDDIEPIEVGKMIESVVLPLRSGDGVVQINKQQPDWTVVCEIQGKQAMFAVCQGGDVVADIAICLHSRAAKGLWSQFSESAPSNIGVVNGIKMESPPWAAVRWRASPPVWLERWVTVLAYTLGTEKEEHKKEMEKMIKRLE